YYYRIVRQSMDNFTLLLLRQHMKESVGKVMVTPVKSVDPRVKRTRKLLQQAFIELFQEKGFASISIQDITERATVNRATFYAHRVTWLKLERAPGGGRRVPAETMAGVLSWAIFGTAVQWSRGARTPSAEEMTNQVLLVLTEGAARLTPGLLPE